MELSFLYMIQSCTAQNFTSCHAVLVVAVIVAVIAPVVGCSFEGGELLCSLFSQLPISKIAQVLLLKSQTLATLTTQMSFECPVVVCRPTEQEHDNADSFNNH